MMRRLSLFLIVLTILATTPAFAAEKMIGSSCSSDTNNVDWDTIGQCVSGTFARISNFIANGVSIGTTSLTSGTVLDLGSNTNSMLLPVGTTGQEPTGVPGMFRYNSTTTKLEYYNGAWTPLATTTANNSPVAFTFTDQTGAATSSTISSNAVTLSGFTGTITATCGTGCTAIARNGSWGSTTVSGFSAGDTIAIRLTSSASSGTATTANVTAGTTVSTTWTVTTATGTPTAFSFTNVTGATTGFAVQSNAVTMAGYSGSLTATCNANCIAMAVGGVWGGTTQNISNGQTLAIELFASTASNTAVTTSVTVGTVTSSTWSVTTMVDSCAGYDTTPGTVCPNGDVYAGVSPDTNAKMYTTPCDAGYYLVGSTCTACSSGVWSGSGTTCSTTYATGKYLTWNNGTTSYYATGYTSQVTGKANTAGLYALGGTGSTSDSPYKAADYCATLSAYSTATWYLPATNELNVMYTNKAAIGNFDSTDGSTQVSGAYPGLYWSSSEFINSNSNNERFSDGNEYINPTNKNALLSLRCVRR